MHRVKGMMAEPNIVCYTVVPLQVLMVRSPLHLLPNWIKMQCLYMLLRYAVSQHAAQVWTVPTCCSGMQCPYMLLRY